MTLGPFRQSSTELKGSIVPFLLHSGQHTTALKTYTLGTNKSQAFTLGVLFKSADIFPILSATHTVVN